MPQIASTSNNLHSDKPNKNSKQSAKGVETPKILTNGYHSHANGEVNVETLPEVKHRQDRGRSREKREDNNSKENSEFLSQIAITVQNLQIDLDRITGRVRSLEGQALKALAPQTVSKFRQSSTFGS